MFLIRLAILSDIPALSCLIAASVRELQSSDYSASQIDAALSSVYGVDTCLIADKTYFAVEMQAPQPRIVACGGWSKRKTLYGGDACAGREDSLLNPDQDAAKIRAFFVHPSYVRRGIGTLVLDACEQAAAREGFLRFEMGATLTGVPFYLSRGYTATESIEVPLPNGECLPIIRMEKRRD